MPPVCYWSAIASYHTYLRGRTSFCAFSLTAGVVGELPAGYMHCTGPASRLPRTSPQQPTRRARESRLGLREREKVWHSNSELAPLPRTPKATPVWSRIWQDGALLQVGHGERNREREQQEVERSLLPRAATVLIGPFLTS